MCLCLRFAGVESEGPGLKMVSLPRRRMVNQLISSDKRLEVRIWEVGLFEIVEIRASGSPEGWLLRLLLDAVPQAPSAVSLPKTNPF